VHRAGVLGLVGDLRLPSVPDANRAAAMAYGNGLLVRAESDAEHGIIGRAFERFLLLAGGGVPQPDGIDTGGRGDRLALRPEGAPQFAAAWSEPALDVRRGDGIPNADFA